MRKFGSIVTRLGRDRSGSTAVAFSVALLAMMLAIGIAIDMSRAYNVASRVMTALDAAALAGAKLLDQEGASDGEVRTIAEKYFQAALLGQGVNGVTIASLAISPVRSESKVTVTADVAVATTFGQVAGITSVPFTRSSTVVYKMKKIELAMVLDVTGSMNDGGKIDAMKAAAKDVVDALLTGSTMYQSAVKIGLAPYSASVNLGTYASTVTSGSSADGCVVERSNPTSITAPYNDFTVVSGPPAGSHYACPPAVVQPLTSDRSLLRSTIDGYSAEGWTAGHIGAAWGQYLLSPAWSPVWGVAPAGFTDTSTTKAVIILTDGIFNTSYQSGLASSDSTQTEESYTQFQQICTSLKDKSVAVYTVALDLSDSRALAELQTCASSPGQAFTATNAADLRDVFRDIARRLNSLRVTQ